MEGTADHLPAQLAQNLAQLRLPAELFLNLAQLLRVQSKEDALETTRVFLDLMIRHCNVVLLQKSTTWSPA